MTKSLFSAVVLLSGLALAQLGMGRGPGPHRGPPPEAVQACANLQTGTACGFTLNGQNVTGTCDTAPSGQVACRPEGLPPPPGGKGMKGPPPEAKQACANLSASAACSFTIDGRSIAGTCLNRPMGGELVCHPNDVPMGITRHGPPQESIDACQGKAANAACSFVAPHGGTMTGTCFAPPNGKGLACRPSGM
ncbi:MAG: hypothetical protein AB1730_20790 [Myxococcota bacterium]